MKKIRSWSRSPHRPIFYDVGDIYICRLVPSLYGIHLEWLPLAGESCYEIFYRERDCGAFAKVGQTSGTEFDIENLEAGKHFEFYVQAGEKKSRIRLARTGEAVGTVVNYLHPEDEVYSFSGRYLCSPSLVRLSETVLISSMDVYGPDMPQNLNLIFRSEDNGESWHYVTELFPSFWGKMFLYQGDLYMLSVSHEYGDLLIGKSTDGGYTWSEPVTIFDGSLVYVHQDGTGVHKNPQPVVEFGGRLWNTLEWHENMEYAPMVMSAPIGSDLMDPDNWTFSEPLYYNSRRTTFVEGTRGTVFEGCLVEREGKLYNYMRYNIEPKNSDIAYGLLLSFAVDTDHPEAPLSFDRAIEYPCSRAKFEVKFDEVSGKYYSIGTRIYDPSIGSRSLLSLMVSDDSIHWSVLKDLLDRRDLDPSQAGFQYVDFYFEGEDIIFLCRTALNEPHGFHDTNYQTFHTIKNFRRLVEEAGELPIFKL